MCFASSLHAQITRIPYRVGDKWGLADTNGNIVAPAEYDSVGITMMRNLPFAIRKGNKYGLANGRSAGRLSLPYDSVKMFFADGRPFFKVAENGKWALTDSNGTIETPFYTDIRQIPSDVNSWRYETLEDLCPFLEYQNGKEKGV